MSHVVTVENLSKAYARDQGPQQPYLALRDVLARPFSRAPKPASFWALKDIDFTVRAGERVGIIGHNGAGKSTLLKLMSRITYPSTGRMILQGRVASLLEVGTGFHPELTGRENIYLNGALLGMRRQDIQRHFDDIVDFAEVSDFLDMPVKRYSSGMYVRLAFSVAAHLNPDVLIVDEVLAVGDLSFQKRCLSKMEDVSHSGRTVIFVSHNMGAISRLCDRVLLLDKGHLTCDAPAAQGIQAYVGQLKTDASHATLQLDVSDVRPVGLTHLHLENTAGEVVQEAQLGEPLYCVGQYQLNAPLQSVCLALLLSREGQPIWYSYAHDTQMTRYETHPAGRFSFRVPLPTAVLKEGYLELRFKVGVGQEEMTDPRAVLGLHVVNTGVDLTHRAQRVDRPGALYLPQDWAITPVLQEAS